MASLPKIRRRNRDRSRSPVPVAVIDLTADTPSPVTRQARRRASQFLGAQFPCNNILPRLRIINENIADLQVEPGSTNHSGRSRDLLNNAIDSLRTIPSLLEIDDEPQNSTQTDLKKETSRLAVLLRERMKECGMNIPTFFQTLIEPDQAVSSEDEGLVPHINDTLDGTPSVLSCPICFEDLRPSRKPTTTKCGHLFCEQCIESTLATQKKCPKCKNPITRKSCIRVFL